MGIQQRIMLLVTGLSMISALPCYSQQNLPGPLIPHVLKLIFTPPYPVISCTLSPGSIVAKIGITGGNGGPVTLSIAGGDSTDFAISSGTLPSNIIVAPGGIDPAQCSAFPYTIDKLSI